jgi:hypothetical protein
VRLGLLGLVGLAGCERHCELPEVPVRGGSDEQQEIVALTLQQMQDALVQPVCVDHVRIGRVWWHRRAEGVYNTVTRGIRLDREVDDETLVVNLRHELCHAVEVQNELIEGNEELFSFPEWDDPPYGKRRLSQEAFAFTCQVGPGPLSVLWRDCPQDPDLEGTRLVQREVYGLASEPEPPRVRFERLGSAGLVGAHDLGEVYELDGDLVVELYVEDEHRSVAINPWTGAVREGPAGDGVAELEPPPLPAGWELGSGGMIDEQTGLLVAAFEAWTGEVWRALSWTEQGWADAQGPCPHSETRLLRYGDELWSAQLDGATLSWGRWLALP